jgi:hypothetical protein
MQKHMQFAYILTKLVWIGKREGSVTSLRNFELDLIKVIVISASGHFVCYVNILRLRYFR